MRDSLTLNQELRDAIDREIAARTKMHQAQVARFKAVKSSLLAAGAPAAPAALAPLALLAHGDSWFDYPLAGNAVSFSDTDIIAQLGWMGTVNPLILNVAHYGDATTEEMSLPKQQRTIDALQDSDNWTTNAKPDAILFSGGGDDIAGNQFCIYLNYAMPGASGLNDARFKGALASVEASYQDLFAFRDRYASGVPIFGHCYDFAIPNGTNPGCAGPWLKPSLDYCGWNVAQGTQIVRQALLELKALLLRFAGDPANNFILVDT